ncbi:hypothetical protein KEH51_04785 [[Brevibacterium] frigoritolerans]|uniref:Competence protein CoiA C-terminal domain-containing protein n=1 Tax=Peribacillus frigoritolerans TaxID=450367 RepID=A0A941FPD9_9BACI|nr:hypothetical protein [Peribacillus frigoritolerans]
MQSFFEALYLHHISPATLPIEVGVPVRGMLLIETASIEWQAWLYMDAFQEKRTGEKIYMADIIRIFRKRSKKGEIKFRPLPLLHEKPSSILLINISCFWNNWVIYQSWKKGF